MNARLANLFTKFLFTCLYVFWLISTLILAGALFLDQISVNFSNCLTGLILTLQKMEQLATWRLEFLRLIREYQRNVRLASVFALHENLGEHC